MQLIADSCPDGPCPRIYRLDDGDLVVQGYVHDAPTPTGHQSVRVQAWLIAEAGRVLATSTVTTAGEVAGCGVHPLNDADVLVTGMSDTSVVVPVGEALVRVPAQLLTEFAASLSAAV